MIARIIVPILVLLLAADLYVDLHLLRHLKRRRLLWRSLWWIQSVAVVAYSVVLAAARNFAPDDISVLNCYLMLLGGWAVPKVVFSVCSLLGWGHCAYHKTRTNWGNHIGLLLGFIISCCSFYGFTLGFNRITVRRVTFRSKSLPAAFDGYRIVQFSDLHIGTYTGSRTSVLHAVLDSINAQSPDMIVFTGDLQNMRPSEIQPHRQALAALRAKDGVFSVLGNHDYAFYLNVGDKERRQVCRQMVEMQKSLGWRLLLNENAVVRRGADSIVVAGMEYEGNSVRVPSRGDIMKTLQGVDQKSAFVLMLQHDPTSWRTDILLHSCSQLTLSGHTHAGQVKLFGFSPASLVYNEWDGMYTAGQRAINVSRGVGGFAPFRLGCPGEVVVIELRRK